MTLTALNTKGNKLEEEQKTLNMEAKVDEDDGTFTNISLADDTGKPLGIFNVFCFVFLVTPFLPFRAVS